MGRTDRVLNIGVFLAQLALIGFVIFYLALPSRRESAHGSATFRTGGARVEFHAGALYLVDENDPSHWFEVNLTTQQASALGTALTAWSKN